jgi:peptide/nickel transport system permease protein
MAADATQAAALAKAGDSGRRSWTGRARGLPIFSLIVLGVVVFCGIFGPWIVPHDPEVPDPILRLRPPVWEDGGSWDYPLGTDPLGRDILSRLIDGARVSLLIGIASVLIAGTIGVLIALLSGYFQGSTDAVLMRVTDAMIAMPFLVIGVAAAGFFGASLRNVILILGFLSWASYARVLRGEVLQVKQADYVTLARITGVPTWRILLRHIFPALANTLIVLATLQVGIAIVAAASLGFLGLGVQPPQAEWGSMLADGRLYIQTSWWVVTMPGIVIALTVMSINFLGDWLRVRLDPKQRGL